MTESGFEEVTHDRTTPVTSNEESPTPQRTGKVIKYSKWQNVFVNGEPLVFVK